MPEHRVLPDFAVAREQFRAAAVAAGAVLAAHIHPERSPRGEALATDVAWLGLRDAGRVLVIVSGTVWHAVKPPGSRPTPRPC